VSYDEPWGDEVGEGWKQIVLDTHARLKYLDPDYKIGQIKEKFAGLRYYYESSLDWEDIRRKIMTDVVTAAEARCDRTCEYCGAPGEVRDVGWWKTLCDQHHEERNGTKTNKGEHHGSEGQ
jgi:hypothetical protein